MAERLRGRAGVEQRKRRLKAEPLCRDCLAEGVCTPSTVPDHIKPLALGGSDADSNIRCLCDDHHAKRTAEQFGFRDVQPVGDDGWPIETTRGGQKKFAGDGVGHRRRHKIRKIAD